ncbi:hypothetical protein Agub_g8777, partial [Astrephomene gubernaculifera]
MRSTHLLLIAVSLTAIFPVKCDFGQAIVNEAVDLFAANSGEDERDPRSMEDLLHWAIANSDPGKLAAQAEEAQRIQMVKDLKEQRRRVKELLDHVRSQPTETDMLKEGIAILRRPAASETELLAALQTLQVLVEPIDNANDLQPLGGIAPVVTQLTHGSPEVAAAAAHVLGTAASNNPTFQRQLLSDHPGIVSTLLQVSQSAQEESAVKGMYAVAALVRNTQEARRAFVDAGGFSHLELLLRGGLVAPRVKRKALSLFMDLVDTQPAGTTAGGAAGGAAAAATGTAAGVDTLGVAEGVAFGSGSRLEKEDAGMQHFSTIRLGGQDGSGEEAPTQHMSAGDGGDSTGDSALAFAAIQTGLPEAVVSLLAQPDPDMQEKALLVLQRLAGEPVALQVLRANGAGEALQQLQQQLRAEAPGPQDEPDPYHDYLVDLSRQVAALMATTTTTRGAPAAAAAAPFEGSGAAASPPSSAGYDHTSRRRGSSGEESGVSAAAAAAGSE